MIFPRSCVSKLFLLTASITFSLLIFSCGSTNSVSKEDATQTQKNIPQAVVYEKLNLVFAGDIMAHTVNYNPGKFSRIWEDVTPLIKQGDLAFANIEAPVNDKKEWSSYPAFNMHSTYIQAAVDAGFNVFSLTNNHTNDWYLEGIKATRDYFASRKDVTACGLRTKNDGNLTYRIIEKKGWKVLFVSITELLNRPDYASWIDYFPSKKQVNLIEQLKKIGSENSHDLFVISVHTDEEEYKTAVTESHRKFFKRLAEECGIDIVWANHPHVYKEFEKITVTKDSKNRTAFIMYANGNTISGQRTSPSLAKKENSRDNTGDGLIIKLTYEKNQDSAAVLSAVESELITTYIQPDGQFVIRLVDDDLIHCLNRAGLRSWAKYLEERKKLFETLKGKSQWQ